MSTETVETTPSIFAALSSVMAEVGAVGKEGRNAQQGFNFRGVDAVVIAVAPALRKHGVVVVPRVLEREREVGTTQRGGTMETIYLTVQYTLYGPNGDSVMSTVYSQANDTADKATAKAMSVAYRTFWLQVLCIPTDEPDPDESYMERGPVSALSGEQISKIASFIPFFPKINEEIEKAIGRRGTSQDMTPAEADKVITHLEAAKAALNAEEES
jgi:ERF superfamily